MAEMRDILVLFVHLLVTAIRLMRPGGIRSIVAESVFLRHQLLVLNRPRRRAPDLRPFDRIKGPSAELIAAIVEMKQRNPRFGYQRIADQIALAFNVPVDKDTVRRVLAKHFRPDPDRGGPSWLTFLGHCKDSLWSVDLFHRESLILNTHWVMVVMDHCTRRIIGFAVHKGTVDGSAGCSGGSFAEPLYPHI